MSRSDRHQGLRRRRRPRRHPPLAADPSIRGFTTNPTLMRKAGVADYEAFAQQVLESHHRRPVSFEVFSDDFDEMERQALQDRHLGRNVYVKIPSPTPPGESSAKLVRRLAADGVQLNVTALLTLDQVRTVAEASKTSAGASSRSSPGGSPTPAGTRSR